MITRLAGVAALGAGLALLIGFLGSVIPDINQYTVPIFYGLAAVGLVGILQRQVGVRPGLAWLGFGAALLGLVAGISGFVLAAAGVLPASGGEYGFVSALALWIGSTVLGTTVLAIGVLPKAVGMAITIGAPIAMIGLVAGRGGAAGDVLAIVSQLGIVIYALGWVGVGLSLLAAQPREGVLGPAS